MAPESKTADDYTSAVVVSAAKARPDSEELQLELFEGAFDQPRRFVRPHHHHSRAAETSLRGGVQSAAAPKKTTTTTASMWKIGARKSSAAYSDGPESSMTNDDFSRLDDGEHSEIESQAEFGHPAGDPLVFAPPAVPLEMDMAESNYESSSAHTSVKQESAAAAVDTVEEPERSPGNRSPGNRSPGNRSPRDEQAPQQDEATADEDAYVQHWMETHFTHSDAGEDFLDDNNSQHSTVSKGINELDRFTTEVNHRQDEQARQHREVWNKRNVSIFSPFSRRSIRNRYVGYTDVMKEIYEDKLNDSPFYRRSMRNPYLGYLLRRFPRLFSLFFAVLVPCCVLLMMSLILGLWLAKLEAGGEVAANDSNLAVKATTSLSSVVIPDLTAKMPRLCTRLFLEGREGQENEIFDHFFDGDFGLEVDTVVNRVDISSVDAEALFNYMMKCGEAARSKSAAFLDQAISDAIETSPDLSFNWIRCFVGASDLQGSFRTGHIEISEVNPQAQAEYYTFQWEQSRVALQEQFVGENLAAGMSEDEAEDKAFQDAVMLATGGDGCELNSAGSAWFWFTVMTTIGYGNQAPVTVGGRVLMFSFGFFSIMVFASILSSAGLIFVFVFDDMVKLHKPIHFLQRPIWGCLLFAALCYGWMCLIAEVAVVWKEERLGKQLSFYEGYWFAYITTVTVGLGDTFLEPEVIMNRDLWYFPLLVLTGFTLLSAFLAKFSALVDDVLQTKNRRTFVESLLKDVEHLDRLIMEYPNDKPGDLRFILDQIEEMEPDN